MADGEIILGVDVDAKQAEEKIQRLTNELAKLKINNSNLSPKLREIAQEAGLCEQHILRLKNALRNANDSTVISKLNREIQANEQYLKTLINEYSKILSKQQEIKSSIASINKEIGDIRKEKIDALEESHRRAAQAANEQKQATTELAANSRTLSESILPIPNLLNGVSRALSRISHLATSAFVFNIISAGFRRMAKWIINLLYLDQDFLSSLKQIKANLLTAFAPIYQAVLPLLKKLAEAIVWVTQYLAKLISLLTGKPIEFNQNSACVMDFEVRYSTALGKISKVRANNANSIAKASKKRVKNAAAIEKASKKVDKNVKNLNKKLKKTDSFLAKFDKIDVLKKDKFNKLDKLDKLKVLKGLKNPVNIAENLGGLDGLKNLDRLGDLDNLDSLDGLDGLKKLDIPDSNLEFKKLDDWNNNAIEWAENTNAFINKLKKIPKNIDKQLDKLDKIKPGSKKFIKNLGVGALATTGLGLLTKGKIFKPVGKFLIGGAKVLTSTFKGVKNFAKPIWQGIKGGYKAFKINRAFTPSWARALKTNQAGTPFLTRIKNVLKPIVGGVKEAFKPIKEWSKKYFNKGTWGAIKTFAKAHPAITGAVGVGALATYGANKYFGYKDWKEKLPEEQKKGKSGWQLFGDYFKMTLGSDLLDFSSLFGFKSADEIFEETFKKPFERWLDKQSPEFKKGKSERELAMEYLKTVPVANKKEEKKEEKEEYKNPNFSIPGFGKIDLNTGKAPVSFDWEKTKKNIEENLGKLGEKFKKFFINIGENSKEIWKKVKEKFSIWFSSAKEKLKIMAGNAKQFFINIGENSKEIWEKAKEKFFEWRKWLGKKFDDIKKWFGEKFEWLGKESEKMWEGIKSAAKGSLNWLIEKTELLLNKIIWGLNWVIKKANKISFDLPDWLGGHHFGINIPEISEVKIPRLAKGSVLKGGDPFLAWVNDQPRGQTNIETPLDTIVRAFKEVAGNNGNQNIVIEANGDLGGIIRELNFRLKNENRRIGTEIMVPSGVL